VGYSYPPRYFPAAVKDRFPRLSTLEREHCLSVYEDAHGAWMERCGGNEAFRRPATDAEWA
jgi:hypothetical protein